MCQLGRIEILGVMLEIKPYLISYEIFGFAGLTLFNLNVSTLNGIVRLKFGFGRGGI
jgi:hypothetical protein